MSDEIAQDKPKGGLSTRDAIVTIATWAFLSLVAYGISPAIGIAGAGCVGFLELGMIALWRIDDERHEAIMSQQKVLEAHHLLLGEITINNKETMMFAVRVLRLVAIGAPGASIAATKMVSELRANPSFADAFADEATPPKTSKPNLHLLKPE